jgi:hypothetical protein
MPLWRTIANREEIEADIAKEDKAVAYWERRLGPRTEITVNQPLQGPRLGCEDQGIRFETGAARPKQALNIPRIGFSTKLDSAGMTTGKRHKPG